MLLRSALDLLCWISCRSLRRCCERIARLSPQTTTLSPAGGQMLARRERCMKPKMLRIIGTVTATCAATAIVASVGYQVSARGDDRRDNGDDDAYTIGLFGDMPYNAL